jgi:hypothetical protein
MKNKEFDTLLSKATHDISLVQDQLSDLEEYKKNLLMIMEIEKQKFNNKVSKNDINFLKEVFSSKNAQFYYDNFVDKKSDVFSPLNSRTSFEYFQLLYPFMTEKDKTNWNKSSLYRHTKTEIASFSRKSFEPNVNKLSWLLKKNKDEFNNYFLKIMTNFWGSVYIDLDTHKELNNYILSRATEKEKKQIIINSVEFPPEGNQDFFENFIKNTNFNKDLLSDNDFCSLLMENALVGGNIKVFGMFLKKGVEIKDTNSMYSALITRLGKNSNDNLFIVLEYIKENKDFYVGTHVLFRTALHYSLDSYGNKGRKDVLMSIIEMYDNEKLLELIPIVEKKIRKETGNAKDEAIEVLSIIEKLSFKNKLEEDLMSTNVSSRVMKV